MIRSTKTYWIVVLGIALILRIAFGIYYGSQDRFIRDSDHWAYDHLAQNVLNGKGYCFTGKSSKFNYVAYKSEETQSFYDDYYYGVVPYGESTSFWEPGYPLFLTSIYKIFGHHLIAPLIVQAFLWAVIIVVIYRILKIMGYPVAGLIAAPIIAVFPVFVFISGSLMSETLFIFSTSISIYLIFLNIKNFRWSVLLVSGLLFGYAFLIRSNSLFWLPIVILFIYLSARKGKIPSVLIWTVGIIIVISPWFDRNHQVHGKYFLLPTKGVRNFWGWNLPLSDAKYRDIRRSITEGKEGVNIDSLKLELIELQTPKLKGTTELERTAELRKLAMENIKAHPGNFIRNYIKRFFLLVSPLIRSYSPPVKISYAMFYTPILILSFLGYYHGLKHNKYFWLFFLLILTFFVITPAFFWRGRFKLIIEPYIIMFASYYLYLLYEKMWLKRRKNQVNL